MTMGRQIPSSTTTWMAPQHALVFSLGEDDLAGRGFAAVNMGFMMRPEW
jgi:hypothetical protein